VIFAQLVDDPSSHPEEFPTDEAQEAERQRLFRLIEELVKWENTTNETVLSAAREEIWKSWRRTCAENAEHSRAKELFNPEKLPAFHDPFAGGGALPLEAQRLGLEAYASDLNPVAVLISKAMIEIPPKFAGRPPVNPESRKKLDHSKTWKGAEGLAEDVRYYGRWMRDEAEKRIGHLYPKIEITGETARDRPDLKPLVGQRLTVIAWLWARTVKSPNPAFAAVDVPLASSFMLSPMSGKEAYVEPVFEDGSYRFTVKVGTPTDSDSTRRGTKAGGSGSSFICLMSGTSMPFDYLRSEAKAGRMGSRLMAIVAEGERTRIYLSPTQEMEAIALSANPRDPPETDLPPKALGFRVQEYGMKKWRDLFTPRQLVALTTFSDLVTDARDRVNRDALDGGLLDDAKHLEAGGAGATGYADAIAMYLGFLVSKLADKGSTICTWDAGPNSSRTPSGRSARVATVRVTFGRQALPMTWDFAEVNFFSDSVGSLETVLGTLTVPLEYLPSKTPSGVSKQLDAAAVLGGFQGAVVSTDPPYYDNIGYADLSDFFYVWLRRSLKSVFPEVFATVAVPKTEELVAAPYRHGGKEKAEAFFLSGMTQAMHRLAERAHPAFPVTIFYAFKQSETESAEGTSSTGWETFLEAVLTAGFGVSGTWPMRTELSSRMVGSGTNALASSIVLVCRRRVETASMATRREFIAELKSYLPEALRRLRHGNIAPVDLAQAAIGPGMAVFTRYSKVLEADGSAMKVRAALELISQSVDEVLTEQEGEFDATTRWALSWFEQFGVNEGPYGVAETLSKAKNSAVSAMQESGIISSRAGKVRLLRRDELPEGWDPETGGRLVLWEITQLLVKRLETGGEQVASDLLRKLGGGMGEAARDLAYRLYSICDRKKWAQEAIPYNSLVVAWPEITRLARGKKPAAPGELFG
jgi:putative DNA methylase